MARKSRVSGPYVAPRPTGPARTADSFQNFLTRTGHGTGNLNDASRYGFNPVSRNRLQMEWVYRGSWIAGMAVDTVAEDMTREGVEIHSDADPDQLQELGQAADKLQVWDKLCETLKWSRLYGGALAMLMIDGQRPDTPLNLDRIGEGQFRGLLPLDRWALLPSLQDLVEDFGPSFGQPRFYDTVVDINTGLPRLKIHHTRVIRLDGVELPYWQRITENLWGQSVLERLWDRLIAFDSVTSGAAQLVYKAHLRTVKIKGYRQAVGTNGPAAAGIAAQLNAIRALQSSEGLTVLDADDDLAVSTYAFSGLDDIMLQFAQQISGALQIPLVRLLGQSPAGMNSTGESDLRMYYDGIKAQQEARLRPGIEALYDVLWRSTFGEPSPDQFDIEFKHLWQMTEEQRATVTNTRTQAVTTAYEAQIIDRATAMKELKDIAKTTGAFANIQDEDITEAEHDPAPSAEALGLEIPKPELGPEAQKPGSGKDPKG